MGETAGEKTASLSFRGEKLHSSSNQLVRVRGIISSQTRIQQQAHCWLAIRHGGSIYTMKNQQMLQIRSPSQPLALAPALVSAHYWKWVYQSIKCDAPAPKPRVLWLPHLSEQRLQQEVTLQLPLPLPLPFFSSSLAFRWYWGEKLPRWFWFQRKSLA